MRYLVLFGLLATSASAQETRMFPASCDTVWPHAMQAFIGNGFGVKASDRAGGVLALEYQRGSSVNKWGSVNKLVGAYTKAKSKGFWTHYEAISISGANAIAVPDGNGCRYQLSIAWQGWERRTFQGEGWWVLESNGALERKLLDEIAGRLPTEPIAEKPKPEPPKESVKEPVKEAPKPEPVKEAPKQEDTRVVTLPG